MSAIHFGFIRNDLVQYNSLPPVCTAYDTNLCAFESKLEADDCEYDDGMWNLPNCANRYIT